MKPSADVCDQHDGLVEVMGECTDHRHDLGFGFRVKVAGRLIGEHHLGLGHNARAMPTRCCWLPTSGAGNAETMAEPDSFEYATRRTFALFLGHAAEHQRHCHIFQCCMGSHQIIGLEDKSDVPLTECRQTVLSEFGDIVFAYVTAPRVGFSRPAN